jgi:beta-glucosidase
MKELCRSVRFRARGLLPSAGAALALAACLSPRYDGLEGVNGGLNGAGGSSGFGGNSGLGQGGSSASTLPGGGELNPGQVMGPGAGIDTSGGAPPLECTSSPVVRFTKIKDPDTDPALASRVEAMSLEQRIQQMYGWPNCSYQGTECFQQQPLQEQNLPLWQMRDGPRGVRRVGPGTATAFPVPVARAASFDVDLERRIGDAIGVQMLAFKYDLMLAPTVNTLRHPGWGRAQETYGEDTVVLGEMGAAFVLGVQAHVPTCIKHYAANTTEGNRELMSADMDLQTLREVYTKQFQIAIEKSDPACVMAAYNKVNGTFSAQNELLLTTILRSEWGWKGFVLSDWGATKATAPSALAGLDLEMPDNLYYGSLLGQVPNPVPATRISQAVRRILNVKQQFGQLEASYQSRPVDENVQNRPEMLSLAQEAAEKGMVLLENKGNILPLTGQRILVVGPDGDVGRLGDSGSSQVAANPALVVTPFGGLRTLGATRGVTVDYQADLAPAVQAAAGYNAVILVVAMQHSDEGEGYGGGDDRDSLDLNGPHPEHWPEGQKPRQWIQQLAAANPNLIVVLSVGSAIVEPSLDSAKALLYSFYPGQAGGTALARLLFGEVNFSGKLPFTIATDPAQYPTFGNGDTQTAATYDYFHGYRKFDHDGVVPRYYFGSGISYTQFTYSNLSVPCNAGVSPDGLLIAEVDVTNSGTQPGTEIVQMYVGYPNTTVRRSVKELKAFKRVPLMPGETTRVQLSVPARELRYYNEASGWQLEPVQHQVLVGPSADPTKLLSASFQVLGG